jgi:chaperonin cofactor prefoldin
MTDDIEEKVKDLELRITTLEKKKKIESIHRMASMIRIASHR